MQTFSSPGLPAQLRRLKPGREHAVEAQRVTKLSKQLRTTCALSVYIHKLPQEQDLALEAAADRHTVRQAAYAL